MKKVLLVVCLVLFAGSAFGSKEISSVNPTCFYIGDYNKVLTLEVKNGEFPAKPSVGMSSAGASIMNFVLNVSQDKKKCEVNVNIPIDRPAGLYDIGVYDSSTYELVFEGKKAVNIKKPSLVSISPSQGKSFAMLENVEIIGEGTHFRENYTQVSFMNAPLMVGPLVVNSPTKVTFKTLEIDTTQPGKFTVCVSSNLGVNDQMEKVKLIDAFEVLDATKPVITEITPNKVFVGKEQVISVKCKNTHFNGSFPPLVTFIPDWVKAIEVAVINETTLNIKVFVQPLAYQGMKDQNVGMTIKNQISQLLTEEVSKADALLIKAERKIHKRP